MNSVSLYLYKQKIKRPFFDAPVDRNLEFIVVIPCYNESDLGPCLSSIESAAKLAGVYIEVLIIINESEHSPQEVKIQNRITQAWLSGRAHQVTVLVVFLDSVPAKQAGVGFARKWGMDEAVCRWASIDRMSGILCSVDADTRVETNYFLEIKRSSILADWECLVIHYEHDWSAVTDPVQVRAIVDYELHLRYYIKALGYAGFPYAFHTLGSAFAVKTIAYAQVGGMPSRSAGEDFYFIHKFSKRNTIARLGSTTVHPSARISDRVPFGTGKAIMDRMSDPLIEFRTYAWQSFVDLNKFLNQSDILYGSSDLGSLNLSPGVLAFLHHTQFEKRLEAIKKNTASPESFRKRFFNEMDAFMMMKYVHYMRDHYYENNLLLDACNSLLRVTMTGFKPIWNAVGLLEVFRNSDRHLTPVS